ncbi:MAG: hypothetical protein ACRDJ5_06790, partial [Actinomycetota bacterium]
MTGDRDERREDARKAPSEEHVEERAQELLHGGEEGSAPVAEDEDSARRAAERMLEDSEARTHDPAARDPEDDSVIRRD